MERLRNKAMTDEEEGEFQGGARKDAVIAYKEAPNFEILTNLPIRFN